MRRLIFKTMLLLLLFSCTKYEEEILIQIQDYENLTPENIETSLKVVNLVVNQTEFDNMYNNFWDEIEMNAFLNVYRDGEALVANEVVEIEIKGSTSQGLDLKSLGVKFDETYNNVNGKLISAETLPFHSLDYIKAFRLRNSGRDFKSTMIKDMSYTKLAIDARLNMDLTYAEQVVVFVNDVFMGIMNLRTEANANGMSQKYEVDKSDITLAKINGDGELEMIDGDFDRISNFVEAINNEDYDYVNNEIDVDNFIDYMIFESYIGNMDWPRNNVRFFAILDGPFRFVLYDLDRVATAGISNSAISFITNSGTDNPITDLFNTMYSNESFKIQYDTRYDEIKNSGLLSPERFDAIVTDYKSNIEYLMPAQINKYGFPETYTKWYINIEHLKSNYKDRVGYLD